MASFEVTAPDFSTAPEFRTCIEAVRGKRNEMRSKKQRAGREKEIKVENKKQKVGMGKKD
jgi:hypothetical protein